MDSNPSHPPGAAGRKRCTACQRILDAEADFPTRKNRSGGRSPRAECHECTRKRGADCRARMDPATRRIEPAFDIDVEEPTNIPGQMTKEVGHGQGIERGQGISPERDNRELSPTGHNAPAHSPASQIGRPVSDFQGAGNRQADLNRDGLAAPVQKRSAGSESAQPDPPLRAPEAPPQDAYLAPFSRPARVLLVPDCHHPYVSRAAWQLMLQAARVWKPDIIVTLGDFADFYAVSAHSKNPNRRHNLESEVEAVNAALDELDALGATKRIFIGGNHCDRLERYLADHAPALFNMVRVRDLFRLSERGWQYVPYKRHARVGKLYLTHDTGRAGRYAHYQSQADFGGHNVAVGHTHRLGFMVEGSAQGEPHFAAQLGWLGDFDAVDYMHQVKARRDWSHGFGVAIMEPNGNVHLSPVAIVGKSCVVGGQLVTLDWRAA